MALYAKITKFIVINILALGVVESHETHRNNESMNALKTRINTWVDNSEKGDRKNPAQDDNLAMHPWLSWQALARWEREYIPIPPEIKKAIIYGSIEEDWDVYLTSSNSDYAHMGDDDETNLFSYFNGVKIFNFDRCVNHFSPCLVDQTADGKVDALFHATNSDTNLMNLKFANTINPLSDDKRGCVAFGHYFHLLGDMTVPAHVRNDAHPVDKDSFEHTFLLSNTKNTDSFSILWTEWQNKHNKFYTEIPWKSNQPANLFSDLATWTRNSFFSDDTIFLNNKNGVDIPGIIDKPAGFGPIYLQTSIESAYGDQINYYIAKRGVFKEWTLDDKEIHTEIFGLTVSKFIQYGALEFDNYLKRTARIVISGTLNIPNESDYTVFCCNIFPDGTTDWNSRINIPIYYDNTYSYECRLVPGREYAFFAQNVAGGQPVRFDGGKAGFVPDWHLLPFTPGSITLQPQDRTVAPGESTTFSVAASGSLNPSFQWQRSLDGTSWADISGATASDYTLTASTADHGVTFRARVRFDTQTEYSRAARLTVLSALTAPTITRQPQPQTVVPGQTVRFTVAAQGNPVPQYQWLRSDDGSTWNPVGTDASSLELTAQAADNGARFMVTASNTQGSVPSATAILSVVSPAAAGFSATGSMQSPRMSHSATVLPNGKVLLAGGVGGNGGVPTAELFDPSTGTFSATGMMNSVRWDHTATPLSDGKVLVAGGSAGDSHANQTASAEIYDPATGTFTSTGNMNDRRVCHSATRLLDGRVLFAGGWSADRYTAEVFDPKTGQFTQTGPLQFPRGYHNATLLPNGKVLITGGMGDSGSILPTEVFDSATGTFTAAGSLVSGGNESTATLLNNGKVLIAGGFGFNVGLSTIEVYDPKNGTSEAVGPLSALRSQHTATLLPDGRVLFAGGSTYSETLASTEVFNPSTGTLSSGDTMTASRRGHTATLLQDGRVLIAGGSGNSAELYTIISQTALPSVPTGLTPGNATFPGATVPTLTPSLSWNPSPGATSYNVIVVDANTQAQVFTQTTSATSVVCTSLKEGATYAWSVSASNAIGTSQAAPVRIFTVNQQALPPTPTGLTPGAGSSPGTTVTSLSPVLSWNASPGATGYSVAVVRHSDAAPIFAQNVSATSVTCPSLQNGESYAWTVSAYNAIGNSPSATLVYFTVAQSSPAPATPTGLAPGGPVSQGVTISTQTPTLTWNPSSGATSYSVVLLNASSGATVLMTNVTGNSIPCPTLEKGIPYAWSVTAQGPSGSSASASMTFFTVVAPTAAPWVGSVSPASMTASSTALTTLTVTGSNFSTSGGYLLFTDPGGQPYRSTSHPDRVLSVTSSQWQYRINNGGTKGTWRVQVVNADGQRSNAVTFSVQ